MPKPADKNTLTTYLLSSLGLVVVLLLAALNIDSLLDNKSVLGASITNMQPISRNFEVLFWEGFLSENPNYFEGWLELAKLQIAEGKPSAARQSINAAKHIDPNSAEIKKLERLIGV